MAQKHYNEIDFMRSILIMLVILVHIVNFGNLYPSLKAGILSFMMPAFLFITGYLVNINKNFRQFGLYIIQILLPYLVMTVGYMWLSMYLPVRDGIKNMDLPTIYRVVFVTSIGPYWFLHAMIVCGIIYYISFHISHKLSTIAKLSLCAGIMIIVSLYTPFLSISVAAYYFMGVCVRSLAKGFVLSRCANLWTIIPFVLLIVNHDFWNWGTLSVLACVLCFISFTTEIYRHTKGKLKRSLDYVGRNTLPIYIFHPIFTMAAKFYLPLFNFDGTGILHSMVTVALGVLGSLALAYFMDRLKLSYIFGKQKILR